MKRGRVFPRLLLLSPLLLVALVLVSANLRTLAATSPEAGVEPLTVAAASDFQFAFGEIAPLFERATGRPITFMFGSTGNLLRQIENGAPIDLFAPADGSYLDGLAQRGLTVAGTQQELGLGRLALITHVDGDVQVERLEDLLAPTVRYIALANPAHAPYGMAAKEALQRAGLWDALAPKIVYADSVSQAAQFVRTRNADAGLVGMAVARGPELRAIDVDASLYRALRPAVVVLKTTGDEPAARRFAAFLREPPAQRVLERYGFISIEATATP